MHKLHLWHSCLLLHCVKSIKATSWFYFAAQPFFSVMLKLEQHSWVLNHLVDDLRKTVGLYASCKRTASMQKDETYNSRNYPNLILLFVLFFFHICLLVSVHFHHCTCLWGGHTAQLNEIVLQGWEGPSFYDNFGTIVMSPLLCKDDKLWWHRWADLLGGCSVSTNEYPKSLIKPFLFQPCDRLAPPVNWRKAQRRTNLTTWGSILYSQKGINL